MPQLDQSMQWTILIQIDVVWVVKGPSDFDAGRFDHVRFELALRVAQTHEYAPKTLIDDYHTLVAEEADLELGLP